METFIHDMNITVVVTRHSEIDSTYACEVQFCGVTMWKGFTGAHYAEPASRKALKACMENLARSMQTAPRT